MIGTVLKPSRKSNLKPGSKPAPSPLPGSRLCSRLVVRRAASVGAAARGHLCIHPAVTVPCVLGRAGPTCRKREGDKATPVGPMRLLYGYYRADRLSRPASRLPMQRLLQGQGWCDEPASPRYNRPTPLPLQASGETMWRDDGLYDVVVVLDYNIAPRRKGLGSAIFLHCAKVDGDKGGLKPTLGCIALRPADMRRLLPRLAKGTRIVVL